MCISDNSISKCRYRNGVWQGKRERWKLYCLTYLRRMSSLYSKTLKELSNINFMLYCSDHLHSTMFNLNDLSEQKSLRDFRLKKAYIGRICDMIDWTRPTTGKQYTCHSIYATCLFLQCLVTKTRWYYLDEKFGLFHSQMSEHLWEMVETFTEKYA